MKLTLTLLLFFCSTAFAQNNQFKITLDDVVKSALLRTDTAKSLKAQKSLSESYSALADAQYNWNFEAEANRLDNRNENSTPFSPNSIQATGLSLGLNKYFSTGTRFGVKLQGSKNALGFPPAANTTVPDYYESIGSISISQNLLKDSFGSAARNTEKNYQILSEKNDLEYKQNVADYAVAVINQFFSSWLAQQNVFAAEKNLQTKNKLLQASQIKFSRGTAEKAEFLQAEAAKLVAEANLAEAEENLNRNWRELIIKMKFPEMYLSVPAKEIDLSYEKINLDVEKSCAASLENIEKTQQVQISKLGFEAATLQNKAVQSQTLPELSLNASLNSNGINKDLGESQNEVGSNTNPNWAVSLVFKKSLGNDANKASRIQSQAQLLQQQAEFSRVVDDQKVNFKKLCADLAITNLNIEKLNAVLNKQTERSKLEETRFRLGRSTVLQVIQAADDAVSADLAYKRSVASQQVLKWQIMNANNEIQKQIAQWTEAGSNE
jgi:outer membrane protein TolC